MVKTEGSLQSEAAFKKDWTKGSIIGNLLLLSWPMVVMEGLYVGSQIVDLIWVGRLGSASIAGVGIVSILILLVASVDIGIILGARAMIARFVGAGDLRSANNVAGQLFVLGVTWGVIMTAIGILLAEQAVLVALDGVPDGRPDRNRIQTQVVADLVDLDNGFQVVVQEVRADHSKGLVLRLVTDPVVQLQSELAAPLCHLPPAGNGALPAAIAFVAFSGDHGIVANPAGPLGGKINCPSPSPVLHR